MLRSLVITRTVHTSALLGLLLAACGGDGSSPTEPTTTSTGTTVAPSPSVTPTTSVQPTTTTPGPVVTPPVTPTGPTGDTGGPTGDTSGPTGDTAGPTGDTSGPTGDSGASSGPTGTTTSPTTSTGPSGGSSAPPDDTGTPPDPTGDPNPSGLPEPGDGGVARPSGTAGNLKVVPWAGFAGALSYSFDDATGSQTGNKAAMLALDAKFTFYLTPNAGGNPLDAMYTEARDQGHELGNHTLSHAHNPPGSDAEEMQAWLMEKYQIVAYTLAAPYGDTGTLNTIREQKFLLDRGVNGGTVGADGNTDWNQVPTAIPAQGAGESVFKGYADTAAGNKWQTVCIHGFTTGGAGGFQPVDFNGWKAGVEYAQTKNVWLGSMMDVASYLIGGKAVSSATPAAEGGGQKWTWTLKDTFPPDRYVRVTVDGGTLSQGGTALPWNEHGFYEVALDAGELTLTP
jgi:hypothetical protein